MQKSIELLKQPFQSSSGLTPQFKIFATTFSKELTKFLEKKGCTKIRINRNHFYLSGFFTHPNGQIWYINFGDVRWPLTECKHDMLYRTAISYEDYHGGTNQYINLTALELWEIFK